MSSKSNYEKIISTEIVFRGHPDKCCDQISAAILDECVRQDPKTRAGIEVVGGKGIIFVTGELTTKAKINVKKIVKRVLADVGYRTNYKVINNIGMQSPDINQGVDRADGEIGAGDQGMVYGYACTDTPQLLPKAQVILQELAQTYDELRQEYPEEFYPDGKAQITGVFDKDMRLLRIKTFLISYQNCEKNRAKTDSIIKSMVLSITRKYGVEVEQFLINPTGKFLIGGFDGDSGLTNRKIVVDNYQAFAQIGGGGLNGKDSTKVDFSAAHKARELAKRLVRGKGYRWALVQISYAIGVAEPVSINIETSSGHKETPQSWYKECTPKRMIEDLDLLNVDYEDLAKFGHFKD